MGVRYINSSGVNGNNRDNSYSYQGTVMSGITGDVTNNRGPNIREIMSSQMRPNTSLED